MRKACTPEAQHTELYRLLEVPKQIMRANKIVIVKARRPMNSSSVVAERRDDNLSVVWKMDEGKPLALEVSSAPERQRALRATARARIGGSKGWQ